uniref:sce7726 family protein n=1 Tax=Paenibacillus gorillae TaxID=1243662 RepID=UPI0012DD994B
MNLSEDVKYLRLFSNFYNRSYLIDFINKKNNKIKEVLINSNNNLNIFDKIQDLTYAEFFNYVYQEIKDNYKCEYVYLNEIFVNEILKNHDEQHSIITELYVNKSQADLVVINGTTTIYEIKTELDSLYRLSKQLNDYVQVFDRVYVVTYLQMIEKLFLLLNSDENLSKVGVYVLNENGNLVLIKKSGSHKKKLNKDIIFEILTRKEFEVFNEDFYLAKDIFTNLSVTKAHNYFKDILFSRGKNTEYLSK